MVAMSIPIGIKCMGCNRARQYFGVSVKGMKDLDWQ